jgi:hypothetical protein
MQYLFPTYQCDNLPSGKSVIKKFIGNDLVEEMHSYMSMDIMQIGIQIGYRDGVRISEIYFCKSKLVGRKTYEERRASYEDMPAANAAIEDESAVLRRMMAKEKREKRLLAKQHKLDPEAAHKNDAFCVQIMQKGITKNAVEWIRDKKHTLGEKDWSSSNRLISRLRSLDCIHIYVCEIDVYEQKENTGHLGAMQNCEVN